VRVPSRQSCFSAVSHSFWNQSIRLADLRDWRSLSWTQSQSAAGWGWKMKSNDNWTERLHACRGRCRLCAAVNSARTTIYGAWVGITDTFQLTNDSCSCSRQLTTVWLCSAASSLYTWAQHNTELYNYYWNYWHESRTQNHKITRYNTVLPCDMISLTYRYAKITNRWSAQSIRGHEKIKV